MDNYLPSYRTILRVQKNNNQCDHLGLQEISVYEKALARYCKAVLEHNKSACNIHNCVNLVGFQYLLLSKLKLLWSRVKDYSPIGSKKTVLMDFDEE